MLFVPRDSPGSSEAAQGLVEYAVIILLVALVVIVGLTTFGFAVEAMYSRVLDSWPGGASGNGEETMQMIRHMVHLL